MDMKIKELNERIDKYFSEISDEQLRLDLEKASYKIYKNVKIQILDRGFLGEEFFFSQRGNSRLSVHRNEDLVFKDLFEPDNYAFHYRMAA